jgi:hypothetical protein
MAMSQPEQSLLRQTLAAFATGHLDKDRVMRALVGYDRWFVPAPFATDVLGEAVFDRTILLGTGVDLASVNLTIFSDPEAVLMAYGQPLGPYVGGLPGRSVFAALDDRFESLRVNPASPQDQQWFVGRDAFQVARLWAGAVSLERELAGGVIPHRLMRAYAGYTLLVAKADRTPVLSPMSDGASMCAVAFTAPDRASAFVSRLPAEQQAAVGGATLDGAAMFGHLSQMNVAGLLVNSDEQPATVFVPRADFERVLASG